MAYVIGIALMGFGALTALSSGQLAAALFALGLFVVFKKALG